MEVPEYSRRTIAAYEGFAAHYDTLSGPELEPNIESALRRIAKLVQPGGLVLEIGSGPGREADFLEQLGIHVRRTDATQAFVDIQAGRGRTVHLVNVISDDLGGPYDAVVALCVLIHVRRSQTDLVLRKVAASLSPGGVFYMSVRDGSGEEEGDYHMVYWQHEEFAARLIRAGLSVEWHERHVDCDDDAWLSYIARKA
ncbi:methyltransferase [Streptomyces sp. SID13031]|nr:class I SAM-dependent methyltransferase [Streptomyces sp. SID13031]NEA31242.1 methyltransferase [Streptomyces sp. SID13031]